MLAFVRRRFPSLLFVFPLMISATAHADSDWLPVRDQNPLVLGSGLPLLPQPTLAAGQWSVAAQIDESNTQQISSLSGRFPNDPGMHVIFGAETRESRVTLAYTLSDDWSVRASIGAEWIGVGFLDKPIEHFHDLIGAPQGFRKGRLGEKPPVVRIVDGAQTLYSLTQPSDALAPLLVDLTHTWNVSDSSRYGVSLGIKLPTGDTHDLSDLGDKATSISAFGDWMVFDNIELGARAGLMFAHGNDILPALARTTVPFGDVYARVALGTRWSAQVQYDAHTGLYREVPVFIGRAGVFTFGLVRALDNGTELQLGLSEDLPIAHTQDVSLLVALRLPLGQSQQPQ